MPLKYFVIVLRKFLTEEDLKEVELSLLSNEMKENLKLCINEIRCSAPNQDEPILRLLSKRSERSNLPVNFFFANKCTSVFTQNMETFLMCENNRSEK